MRRAVALTWFSGLAFLVYGLLGLASLSMVEEFRRFGLESLRVPTSVLEVLGGSGLLIGLRWPPALWIGSTGLTFLMLIAFCVRLSMRDNFLASAPSLAFTVVNAYILVDLVHSRASHM